MLVFQNILHKYKNLNPQRQKTELDTQHISC